MFILPITRSPGEHGEDDHTAGIVARARRSFPLNIHMSVNGFIVCALVIQTLSIAGIMPAEVWIMQPGYALTVCMGLLTLSTSILFSLKSLLTQSSEGEVHAVDGAETEAAEPTPDEEWETAPSRSATPVAVVLDNSRTVQAIVEKSLAKAAIQSICVGDVSAARQALQANAIELLVVGVAPQESDGFAPLRDLCRTKGIPVLTLRSGKTSAPGLSDASAVTAMPILPDELARAALNLIRPRAAARDVAPGIDSPPLRELPKLELDPLDARALGDLEKLGGRDFVRDIVAQFVADAATVLANLTAAVTSRDSKAFREQAHALRSCAANVGAQNVYRMCLAWRDLDPQEIAASGARYMQMLEAEFERVRGALIPMLQQGGGEGRDPDNKAA